MAPSVEIVVLHPADAERAQAGGADRLHVCAWPDDAGGTSALGRSVAPADVSAVLRSTDLPVRVTLRLSDGLTTQGGEFTRLLGLASQYLSLGAEGLVFGFLTPDLRVDVDVCHELADSLQGAPWSFDRAFDQVLDPRQGWRGLQQLPGLDAVHTAGAVRGMDAGFDDLLAFASQDPTFAAVAVAAGDVHPEHVPWLVRAGVSRVHLEAEVRPGGSWSKAYVDAAFVRSWRLLLDAATVPGGAAGAG